MRRVHEIVAASLFFVVAIFELRLNVLVAEGGELSFESVCQALNRSKVTAATHE